MARALRATVDGLREQGRAEGIEIGADVVRRERHRLGARARRTIDDAAVVTVTDTAAMLERVTYHHTADHIIGSLADVEARGTAQCADAAAILGAVAYACGSQSAWVCIEAPDDMTDYTHARLVLGDRVWDVYEEYRPDIPASCDWRIDVVELAEAPLSALRLRRVTQ